MLEDKTIGFALTGSFCTLSRAVAAMQRLAAEGCQIVPIVSYSVASTDTRFGSAAELLAEVEAICHRPVIDSIVGAEPIGPKKLLDALVVMPCTGNTLAKLYHGITDTPVTMACKSHLRNGRPCLLCPATNDGLGANARNIGALMNLKNIYFMPFEQDDAQGKPNSIIGVMELIVPSLEAVLEGQKPRPQLYRQS